MDLAASLGLGDRELVAFVGAGGKKTAIAHLLGTARERGLGALYTTTTHTPPLEGVPLVVTDDDPVDALDGVDLPAALAAGRVDDPDRAATKVRGLDPDAVGRLADARRAAWVLVKADGARRREFKAPGPEEPVLPAGTTHVVPVASVQAVGEPVDAPAVHRPERVAAVAGVGVGETVTPAVVGRVLGSDEGGLKDVPGTAEVTPVVNKADTPRLRDLAREALEVALDGAAAGRRGLVTSFETGYCEVVER
jgi:probable selenium-dependent hydroxylase accessory protein YqeC